MRRPNDLRGLVLLLLRRRRRSAAAFGLAVGALAFVVTSWLPSEEPPPGCGLTETEWSFGAWRYDYLERLDLHGSGDGSYVLGYDQAVRVDASFRFQVDGDELVLSDVAHHGGSTSDEELRTRFTIQEGDFRFEPDHPYDDTEEYGYRCRLELDDLFGHPAVLYGARTR